MEEPLAPVAAGLPNPHLPASHPAWKAVVQVMFQEYPVLINEIVARHPVDVDAPHHETYSAAAATFLELGGNDSLSYSSRGPVLPIH